MKIPVITTTRRERPWKLYLQRGLVLIALLLGMIWLINSVITAMEVQACMNSTPEQVIKLHCSEVLTGRI